MFWKIYASIVLIILTCFTICYQNNNHDFVKITNKDDAYVAFIDSKTGNIYKIADKQQRNYCTTKTKTCMILVSKIDPTIKDFKE